MIFPSLSWRVLQQTENYLIPSVYHEGFHHRIDPPGASIWHSGGRNRCAARPTLTGRQGQVQAHQVHRWADYSVSAIFLGPPPHRLELQVRPAWRSRVLQGRIRGVPQPQGSRRLDNL